MVNKPAIRILMILLSSELIENGNIEEISRLENTSPVCIVFSKYIMEPAIS